METAREYFHSFLRTSNRFKSHENIRRLTLLNEDGSDKGCLWYKNILGGWRLRLDTDTNNEWEERGVIDSIDKIKAFF